MFSSPRPRILIVRLSAIGDVIHGLPVLNALRDDFPDAEIGWVVNERIAPLLAGHPSLSQLLPAPRGWNKSFAKICETRRLVAQFRPDVTVDLQGLTKSAILASFSGAKRRIGFRRPDGREISRILNNQLVRATSRHVVDRNLELLTALGIENVVARFSIPRVETAEVFAEQTLVESGFSSEFVAINPGAGWPSKLWPHERYARVARHVGEVHQLPSIVVWGSAKEKSLAEDIVRKADGHAVLAPETSLLQLGAIVRRARLFVGSDTGPLHLAAAAGTRCVGLYGPWPGERNGPYGAGNITLQKMTVPGGSRARRNASGAAMEAITIEDVCRACDQILSEGRRQAA